MMIRRRRRAHARSAGALLAGVAFFLALAASGCAPRYYYPPAQGVPLLSGPGQVLAGGSVWFEMQRRHVHAHFAAGLPFHMALAGSATRMGIRDEGEGSVLYLEAGPGAYLPLGKGVVVELFGMAGGARYKMRYSPEDWPEASARAAWSQMSLLPVLGWKSRDLEVALSSRLSRISYHDIRVRTGDDGSSARKAARSMRAHDRMFLAEPAITLRSREGMQAAFPSLMYELQLGLSRNLTDPGFPQAKGWGSIGFVYRFDPDHR